MSDEAKPTILTPEERATLTPEQQSEMDTAHHPALLRKLIEDIHRGKARTIPKPFTHDTTAEESRVEAIKEYFHQIERRVSPVEYRKLVDQFEQVNRAYLQLPASQRLSFPKYPPIDRTDFQDRLCIRDMPILEEFTPRTGGRRATLAVQERNTLIRKFRAEASKGEILRYVSEKLDGAEIATPWPDEFKSWTKALESDKQYKARIASIISKS